MTHTAHPARIAALLWPLLVAGLLSLPSSSALADEAPPTEMPSGEATADVPSPAATPAATTDASPEVTASPDSVETAGPTADAPPATEAVTTLDVGLTPPGEATTASEPTTTPMDSGPAADAPPPTEVVITVEDSFTPTGEATTTAVPTASEDPSPAAEVAFPTVSDSQTPAGTTEDPSPTPTLETTPTATPTATVSETPSPTADPAAPSAPSFAPGSILINEVAWAGTLASANDEWIELWNPGPDSVELDGWRLTDGGDIDVALRGAIGPFGFYLLERTDDSTVSDITADRIYTGSLNNNGESLGLRDPSGGWIDTANAGGGAWPAGNASTRASMERHGALDLPANWRTFPGIGGNGLDAEGQAIPGTPRQANPPAEAFATATATPTPSTTPEISPAAPGAVIINELAWAGTLASASDEWIELFNPGSDDVQLEGWRLTDGGDIDVAIQGRLDPGEYYLLERSDDQTVSSIYADRIYSGALSNNGERVRLLDPTGTEIDVVNPGGGPWPAGDGDRRASMERVNGGWRTFTGYFGTGLDAGGQPIRGTPGAPNSGLFPTPEPTWIPGRVVINEVLIRPRHDWEGAGGVDTDDEFIELYNRGPGAVDLRGWTLDDTVVGGSRPYTLGSIRLEAGEFVPLFRSRTGIALNDSGDSVRLSAPDGSPIDKIHYRRVSAVNLSYGRLPDGDDILVYGLWPTPGEKNVVFVPPGPFPVGTIVINEVAWAGTAASATDEWIELWNPSAALIHLDGWVLTDDNDIRINLTGPLPPGAHAVLERSDDRTLSDLVAAGIIRGALADSGERLRLIDPSGAEIDAVGSVGEGWPAGDARSRASMERLDEGWLTFTGDFGRGLDAAGARISGTPGGPNSVLAFESGAAPTACGPGIFEAALPCH